MKHQNRLSTRQIGEAFAIDQIRPPSYAAKRITVDLFLPLCAFEINREMWSKGETVGNVAANLHP